MMNIKFITFVAGFALVSGAIVPDQSSVVQQSQDIDYDPHPNYQFSYKVADAETGDYKAQTEIRDGDVVHGEYSLRDADGYLRSVHYTADSINGFQAVVQRSLPSDENQPEVLVKTLSGSKLEASDLSSPALRNSLENVQNVQNVQKNQVVQTTVQQPTEFVRTYHQQPNVVQSLPTSLHLTPTTHVIHHNAPTTTLLKSAVPATVVTTHHHHHHSPATVIKTPLTAPQHHISYVHYH